MSAPKKRPFEIEPAKMGDTLKETRLLVARITEHVYAYVEEIPQTQIPLPIAEEAIR